MLERALAVLFVASLAVVIFLMLEAGCAPVFPSVNRFPTLACTQ